MKILSNQKSDKAKNSLKGARFVKILHFYLSFFFSLLAFFILILISYILSPVSTRAAAPTNGLVGYGPCDIGSVFDGNITGWNFDPVKYQQSWSANAEFYRVDPVK